MRRLVTILLTTLLFAILFGSCQSSEIVTQNTEAAFYVDSLRYYTGGPEYAPELNVNADSIATVWKKFTNYYIKGKYEKAYKYLNDEGAEGAILIYLRNTTAQYEYINCMKEPILDYCCDDKGYYDELMGSFRLNLEMIKMVIASAWARGQEEEYYVPPHYTELVMSMAQMMLYYEDFEDALPFADEIVAAYEESGYDAVLSHMAALDFVSVVKMKTEGKEAALEEIESFRKKYIEGSELEKEDQIMFALDFMIKQLDDIENEGEELHIEDFE